MIPCQPFIKKSEHHFADKGKMIGVGKEKSVHMSQTIYKKPRHADQYIPTVLPQ